MKFQSMISSSVLSLLALLLLSACGSPEKYLQPTGKSAFVPAQEMNFSTYVEESRRNIEEVLKTVRGEGGYLGGYSTAEAAAMRSPFQLMPSGQQQCQPGTAKGQRGFLLVHGLTDSPYLLRNIADSLHKAYPCGLIRAVLLPGHGTVVGDTLTMKKNQWKEIVEYGVKSFQKEEGITELYLIGFSTGTSLILDYLKTHPSPIQERRDDAIAGVVFLSAAVKAKTDLAFLAPWIRPFKDWESIFAERDAARYESFSFNAVAEFYSLTKPLDEPAYLPHVPMLMALSADDATIDAQAARKLFCSAGKLQRNTLIWYSSLDPQINTEIRNDPTLSCGNIIERTPSSFAPQYKTLNMAHTALPVAPDDEHYGVNGRYHHCKEYDLGKTEVAFKACQQDDAAAVYGENKKLLESERKLDQKYFRRGTFNPDYEYMMQAIFCFVDQSCPMETLIR
ncbi:alpha/beta hydrolase [Desulfobulbus rhabdoformis]|uniref:alpha/beta hydrolase n=1 Tax=Desulfobulbus rhabdoformis TaxID=34032 RepID=UPI001F05FD9D|nr:alpha/beta fold hydrolase [Desulfobulbus rhabdoformis]